MVAAEQARQQEPHPSAPRLSPPPCTHRPTCHGCLIPPHTLTPRPWARSCVDRKAVELGLAGARTDYIQTDAAINKARGGDVPSRIRA